MSCHCQKGKHGRDHSHSCCGESGRCCQQRTIELTQAEYAFLLQLAQIPFLPLARFGMSSRQSEHLSVTALAPVYLTGAEDTIEQIKETGAILLQLEKKGLISLDYDQPLAGYDYDLYHTSAAYRTLTETVAAGSQQPGFLFDRPTLELGSMALTALGQRAVEQLEAR